jgi:hypothetical protein
MPDDEFDEHIAGLLSSRQETVGISLRVPRDLLARLKREAGRRGLPYQTFMKAILEAAVSRVERRGPSPGAGRGRLSEKPAKYAAAKRRVAGGGKSRR